MDNEPLVSIIVPIYKVEKYLRKCIESIISQTYQNIEILLIDDGSPDNCGVICDEYAAKDRRIHVFHERNQGVSVARNIGLDNAQGEWISFIDPDDYLDNDFIEYLVNLMDKTKADISYCSYRYLDENGHQLKREIGKYGIETFTSENSLISLFRKKNDFANYIWNGLFNKKITTRFVPGKNTGQDKDFTVQCIINSRLIAKGNGCKYNHIIRTTGARSVPLKKRMQNGFNTLEHVKGMLKDANEPESVMNAFAEDCMRTYFSYLDKYFEFKVKDKEVFKELRSGIKENTRKAIRGVKGCIASFFLGITGEKIYKAVFYFIRINRRS